MVGAEVDKVYPVRLRKLQFSGPTIYTINSGFYKKNADFYTFCLKSFNQLRPVFIVLTLYSIDTYFDASRQTVFENIVGKGEIARNEQFLFFPQCFLLNQIVVSLLVYIFDVISLFAAEFEKPKIGILGKGLIRIHSSDPRR